MVGFTTIMAMIVGGSALALQALKTNVVNIQRIHTFLRTGLTLPKLIVMM